LRADAGTRTPDPFITSRSGLPQIGSSKPKLAYEKVPICGLGSTPREILGKSWDRIPSSLVDSSSWRSVAMMSTTGKPRGHLQVKGGKNGRRRTFHAFWWDAEGKHGRCLGPAHVRDTGRRAARKSSHLACWRWPQADARARHAEGGRGSTGRHPAGCQSQRADSEEAARDAHTA
jgi:hypothetical protein